LAHEIAEIRAGTQPDRLEDGVQELWGEARVGWSGARSVQNSVSEGGEVRRINSETKALHALHGRPQATELGPEGSVCAQRMVKEPPRCLGAGQGSLRFFESSVQGGQGLLLPLALGGAPAADALSAARPIGFCLASLGEDAVPDDEDARDRGEIDARQAVPANVR
jgi:hypothetical protein